MSQAEDSGQLQIIMTPSTSEMMALKQRQKRPGVFHREIATPARMMPAERMAQPISRVHHSSYSSGMSTENTPTTRYSKAASRFHQRSSLRVMP